MQPSVHLRQGAPGQVDSDECDVGCGGQSRYARFSFPLLLTLFVTFHLQSLFQISDGFEPCTSGADISTYTSTLSDYSKAAEQVPMQVGFVDVEGQGDESEAYDALLVTPLLLLSKTAPPRARTWRCSLRALCARATCCSCNLPSRRSAWACRSLCSTATGTWLCRSRWANMCREAARLPSCII